MSRAKQAGWKQVLEVSSVVAAGLAATGGGALAQATTNAETVKQQQGYKQAREFDASGRVSGPARAGWWNDAVFYQVFVRSFADSTEGPLAGDGIGDFQGLIEKLDYLSGDPATGQGLGVNALWLMPVMESPSYHGYDVVDYMKVNKDYGTDADFRRLMQECHRRGVRVIIDLVLNHTSSKHPWFVSAAKGEGSGGGPGPGAYIIDRDGRTPFKGPWHQTVWHPLKVGKSRTGATYYGLFGSDMPDLNYRDEAVTRAMHGISAWWLGEQGDFTEPPMKVDGFRLDAVRHLIEEGENQDSTAATHEWLKTYRGVWKNAARKDGEPVEREAFCIGEVWSSCDVASSYVGDQLDAVFEFDLAGAMVEACRTGLAKPLAEQQERVLKLYPPNQYGRFLTNHDQPRVMTQLKGDAGAMRVAAALLLTGPGVPFIYYGEEIGLAGDKPDPKIRTPMPWNGQASGGFSTHAPWQALNAGYEHLNVAAERADEGSLWNLYRRLIALRRAEPSLGHGAMAPVKVEGTEAEHVYAFVRAEKMAAPVLVVVNLSGKELTGYRLWAGPGTLEAGGELAARDLLTGNEAGACGVDAAGGFAGYRPREQLRAHECLVLKLTR